MVLSRVHLILCLILIHLSPAMARETAPLPAAEREGLQKTQQLLKNRDERDKYIRTSPQAQDVDRKVEALTGSGSQKEEVYDIAAQVMEKVTVEAGGDPKKMQQLMQEASTNPQAFYEKYFSEAEKQKVRSLADSIEKKKTPGPAGH